MYVSELHIIFARPLCSKSPVNAKTHTLALESKTAGYSVLHVLCVWALRYLVPRSLAVGLRFAIPHSWALALWPPIKCTNHFSNCYDFEPSSTTWA